LLVSETYVINVVNALESVSHGPKESRIYGNLPESLVEPLLPLIMAPRDPDRFPIENLKATNQEFESKEWKKQGFQYPNLRSLLAHSARPADGFSAKDVEAYNAKCLQVAS